MKKYGNGLVASFALVGGLLLLAPAAQATTADVDGDGLRADFEKALRTNPRKADTDRDGLSDGAEVTVHGTNPKHKDSDRDGLSDSREVALGTDPLDADSDDDGLKDGQELKRGTDPNDGDTDDDGISDKKDKSHKHRHNESSEIELKGIVTSVDETGGECKLKLSNALSLTILVTNDTEVEGDLACADLEDKFVEVEGKISGTDELAARKVELEDVDFDSDHDGQCWDDDDDDGDDDDEDDDDDHHHS